MSSDTAEGLHSVGTLRRPDPSGMSAHPSTTVPAERLLRDLGMPLEEIRAVLITDDPRQVRRRLELHGERLLEELIDRRRILAELGVHLADAALERSRIGDPIAAVGGSAG
jgi:hypothetical protein